MVGFFLIFFFFKFIYTKGNDIQIATQGDVVA